MSVKFQSVLGLITGLLLVGGCNSSSSGSSLRDASMGGSNAEVGNGAAVPGADVGAGGTGDSRLSAGDAGGVGLGGSGGQDSGKIVSEPVAPPLEA